MTRRRFISALAAAFMLTSGVATGQEAIKVSSVLELSGPGASVGNNQKNGLELAVKEINEAGGVLGLPIELNFYDNQTNTGMSRGLVQRALDDEPYVIVGPTFSGAFKASVTLTQEAKIPHFTGGTAPELTAMGNPYAFREYLNQESTVPKLVAYAKNSLKVSTIAVIWANTDLGKAGRATILREAQAMGIEVVADLSTELGQADFSSDILRAKESGADALFLYVHEEEAARGLIEAQRQDLGMPIIGDATLINPKVLELAGDAAIGARGFVGLSADAPVEAMQQFAVKFRDTYGYTPDHNGFQGYMVGYVIKTITERVGTVNSEAFAASLRNATITTEEEPNILLTTSWLDNGDTDRDAFLGEVVAGGKIQIIESLPSASH